MRFETEIEASHYYASYFWRQVPPQLLLRPLLDQVVTVGRWREICVIKNEEWSFREKETVRPHERKYKLEWTGLWREERLGWVWCFDQTDFIPGSKDVSLFPWTKNLKYCIVAHVVALPTWDIVQHGGKSTLLPLRTYEGRCFVIPSTDTTQSQAVTHAAAVQHPVCCWSKGQRASRTQSEELKGN